MARVNLWHFYLISILTLSGVLPLQVLVFGNQTIFLQGQFLGFAYVSVLISFLSGVHWAFGLILRRWALQVSSVVLALCPCPVFFARAMVALPPFLGYTPPAHPISPGTRVPKCGM